MGQKLARCGNGMRCVADMVFKQTGKPALTFETPAGLINCWKGDASAGVDRRYGQAKIRLAGYSAGGRVSGYPRAIELQIGPIDAPILHSPSAVSMGNPHAIFWVDDVNGYDLGRFGPMLENHPDIPGAREYLAVRA